MFLDEGEFEREPSNEAAAPSTLDEVAPALVFEAIPTKPIIVELVMSEATPFDHTTIAEPFAVANPKEVEN